MKRSRETLAYLTLIREESYECGTIPPVIKLRKGKVVIGRGSPTVQVDVVMSIKVNEKEIISRTHAEVVGTNGTYVISDRGSINGVFVNGCRIDQHELQEGDIIQFGGVAKMPVGKKLKFSAEHARYIFSFLGSTPGNADRITAAYNTTLNEEKVQSQTSSNKRQRVSNGVASKEDDNGDLARRYDSLSKDYHEAQLEIEKLKAEITIPPHSKPKKSSGKVSPDNSKITSGGRSITKSATSHQALSSAGQVACMIDYSALQDMVKCSLCHMTLLDAVVCRCSHGFCRACIESHIRSRGRNCPVCNDKKHLSGGGRFYYRSENLDSIVYLLHQASSVGDAQAFSDREKEHFKILQKYGIDPMKSPNSDDEEDGDCVLEEGRHSSSKKRPPSKVCEYCGEEGHRHSRCPHDDGRPSRGGFVAESTSFSRGNHQKGGRNRFGNYHGDDDEDEEEGLDSDNSEDF